MNSNEHQRTSMNSNEPPIPSRAGRQDGGGRPKRRVGVKYREGRAGRLGCESLRGRRGVRAAGRNTAGRGLPALPTGPSRWGPV